MVPHEDERILIRAKQLLQVKVSGRSAWSPARPSSTSATRLPASTHAGGGANEFDWSPHDDRNPSGAAT